MNIIGIALVAFYAILFIYIFVVGCICTVCGFLIWLFENHDVDANWRPIAAAAFIGGIVLAGGSAWMAHDSFPMMWSLIK